jgi:hypothetical protein
MNKSTHTDTAPQENQGPTEDPIDTIPPEIKSHFFTTKDKPSLLRDFDVLGFDADHCIVKYNL